MRKVFLTMFVVLLMCSLVSAWDWDNVKSYDDKTKTITITNALGLGNDIAKVQLQTEQINYVIAGNNRKVAEFTIENYNDYQNVFNNMEFYDINDGMKKFDRGFTYKYKTYKDVEVMKYNKVCLMDECYIEEIGYQTEQEEVWNVLDSKKILLNGNITIGIFTTVHKNDYIEWIPELFGKRINEWAIWTSSLDVGLVSYYNCSSLLESVHGGDFDLVVVGAGLAINGAGKIGGGCTFAAGGGHFNITEMDEMLLNKTNNVTLSYWVNTNAAASIANINRRDESWVVYSSGGNYFQANNWGGATLITTTRVTNEWYNVIVRREGTNTTIWLNGTVTDSGTTTDWSGFGYSTVTFGAGLGTSFNGELDEIGFWNRSLSDSEISDLYNAGTGISRDSLDFETPDISYSAQTPADYTSTINTSLYINVSITESNFENMSYNLYNSTLNTTDLVLYLPLDRDSTTQRDISGQGNDGTVTGAVFNSSGKLNGAYEFNRSHYISITDDDSLSFSNSSGMTISLWAKSIDAGNWTGIGSGNNYRHLLGKGAEGNYEYWLRQVNGTTGSTLTFTVSNRTADVTTSSQVNNVFESANWEYITMGMNATDTFIYLNGILKDSDRLNGEITFENGNQPLDLGKRSGGSGGLNFNGTIDEVMIFNRSLSSGEISALYNRSAVNRTMFTTETLEIDWLGLAANDYNYFVDVWDNGEYYNFTKIRNYNSYVDSIFPTIILTSPSKNIPYGYINKTIYVNWTLTETNPSACWYDYNGTNQSVTCGNNNFSFPIESYENRNLTFFANDTSGNQNESFTSWDYNIFQNSIEYKSKSYETQGETFAINLAANSSLSSVNLIYNGTSYSTTNSGGNYSKFLTLSDSNFGNNTFYWNFTYAGNEIKSDTYYQNVSYVNFTKCDGIFTIPYLNFTFKDEGSSTLINATIPTSTFVYYLGGGSVNKSYTYINNSVNMNYTFCASPVDESLKVDMYVQYKSLGYPQRIYNPVELTLPNTTLEKTLYLLATADGLYVTFQVINTAEESLSGVVVNATRTLGGESTIVGDGTTDAAGTVTFWLNPDFSHLVTFLLTGYDLYRTSLVPTQSSYTINLGGISSTVTDYFRGIAQRIRPRQDFLDKNQIYDFNYTLSSSYWDISNFGFRLYYGNGSLITFQSTTTSGVTLIKNNVNMTNESSVYINYYYVVNSTYINGSRTWIIQATDGRSFSIWYFAQDLKTYMDAGMFGFDDFGRILLSFVILVLMVGGLSYNYGLRSEAAIMGIIFGVVFLLDVGLGFIPRISVGGITAIEHFITYITFMILIGIIIKEMRQ